jgi:hypothetical protein
MSKSVPPRGAVRPAPPAKARARAATPAQPARPGAHKLASWLLVVQGLLSAALSLRLEGTVAMAVAVFGGVQALFGVLAALGGSATTRLALGFLGTLVVLLALILAIVPVLWPLIGKAVWVPALFAILSASGLFGLLAAEHATSGRLAAGLAAVLFGWAGYALGAYRVAPTSGDAAVQEAIDKWGLPERSFAAADLGLTLSLPPGWSALREGHGLAGSQGALVTLAGSPGGGVATIRVGSDPRYAPLDALLDRVANEIRSSHASFAELARDDTRVGAVPARRMRVVRSSAGRSREAEVTLWRDATRTFELTVVMPRGPTARAEADAVLQGVAFRAPLEASLRASAAAFLNACPLFSEPVAQRLAALAADVSLPSLFRTGYAEAIRGQARLDSLASLGLREAMADLFRPLGDGERERVGRYFESLRVGARTDPQEDAAVAGRLCGAGRALEPARQARLRELLSRAAEMGRQ